jgi:AcrR family transcriptional regulator
LRSQERLRNALLTLIEDNLFDRITLREITSAAGVSYPTFFNHYDSKESLFQDIARKEIADFLTKGFQNGVLSPEWRPGESICAYIMQRRALWRTLLTAGASEAMRSEFIRRGRDMPRTQPSFQVRFPIDAVSAVIASGVFEIIAWWLAQDAEYPAGQVADMLESLVIEPGLDLARGYFTGRKGLVQTDKRDG